MNSSRRSKPFVLYSFRSSHLSTERHVAIAQIFVHPLPELWLLRSQEQPPRPSDVRSLPEDGSDLFRSEVPRSSHGIDTDAPPIGDCGPLQTPYFLFLNKGSQRKGDH